MSATEGPSLDVLLAEVDWVRALARVLVRDEHLAEDAAQDTWLAALQGGLSDGRNLRGWLARVTHNAIRKARRSDRRRGEREREAARGEALPATDQVVEHFSTQHSVATAVLALEEPLRETILRRYYRGESLATIARRSGVAVSTVEYRLQRGQERLKARLARELGEEDRRWALALVGLIEALPARTPVAGASVVTAWGVLQVALGLAVAGAALVALWGGLPGWVPGPGDAPSETAAGVAGPADGTRRSDSAAPADGDERVALGSPEEPWLAPTSPAAPGSLVVRAHTPDGTPLAGVSITAWPEETSSARPLPAGRLTRADGRARFAGLRPGTYEITGAGLARRAVVPPGGTAEVALEREAGPTLDGVVVDELGAPVPEAAIWFSYGEAERSVGGTVVTTFQEATAVTRTDAGGHFILSGVGRPHLIGAWAEGRAPSLPLHLAERVGDPLQLRLVLPGAGGRVEGVVRDEAGLPVAGALVFLDVASFVETLPGGLRVEGLAPLMVQRSDPAGGFRFPSVRPGARRLVVRAPGRAVWSDELDVRGRETTPVEVRLTAGLTVRGTVTDAGGEPLAEVLVYGTRERWWAVPDVRYATVTRTAADGRFELRGLYAGACWLNASEHGHGHFQELLFGEPGELKTVQVTLSRELELSGRLVDELGAPLAGLDVRAAPQGEWRWRTLETDEEGRFSFTNCEELPHHLRVEEAGQLVARRELEPGGDELILVVPQAARPSAVLTGALQGLAGEPLTPRSVVLVDVETLRRRELALEALPGRGGAFRSAPIPPGTYALTLRARAQADLELEPPLTLAAGVTHDLGLLVCRPAGWLEVDVAGAPSSGGARVLDLRASLTDAEGGPVRRWRFPDAALHAPFSTYLAPGEYTLQLWAPGLVPVRERIEIRAGEPTQRALTLEAGQLRELRFHAPEGSDARGALHLVIERTDGTRVIEEDFHPVGSARVLHLHERLALAPGDYVVLARAGGGLSGRVAFSIGSPNPPPVVCTLAPAALPNDTPTVSDEGSK